MMEFEDQVDDSFRNGNRELVSTVEDLIDELKQLPLDMDLLETVRVSVTCHNGQSLKVDIGEDYD